jgi:hypothetical protein
MNQCKRQCVSSRFRDLVLAGSGLTHGGQPAYAVVWVTHLGGDRFSVSLALKCAGDNIETSIALDMAEVPELVAANRSAQGN